jgi:glycosyltransferase involved in cell wall biosynthesis
MQPVVSVVMPAYNAEETIEEAVVSILNQDLREIELIVVDDGSTDQTGLVLARLQADSRLRVVTQKNAGVVAALNAGIAVAAGTFIARADADDYYSPSRLSLQRSVLDADPRVSLVYTDFFKVYPDGTLTPSTTPGNHDDAMTSLFRGNFVMHSSVMFRRKDFIQAGGYRPEWKHIEDWELWFRLTLLGKMARVGDGVSFLRVHDGSVSAKHEIFQAKAGLKLRWSLIQSQRYPVSSMVHMIRPALKVFVGKHALSVARKVLGRKRYQ